MITPYYHVQGTIIEVGRREGDIVSVELKIESRPFDGKWYTEATAARVSITERLPSASELAGQM